CSYRLDLQGLCSCQVSPARYSRRRRFLRFLKQRTSRLLSNLMGGGSSIPAGAKCGYPQRSHVTGDRTRSGAGPIPMIGDGTGFPIRRKTTGAGSLSITGAGSSIANWDGFGSLERNGALDGCNGDEELSTSVGRRCHPTRSWSNIATSPMCGFSCGPAISSRLVSWASFCQQDVFIRETVVVNQTIMLRERGPVLAVNPGIAPTIIAAAVGRPLRTFEVRPRILAGTTQIQGAMEVRPQDLRQGRA